MFECLVLFHFVLIAEPIEIRDDDLSGLNYLLLLFNLKIEGEKVVGKGDDTDPQLTTQMSAMVGVRNPTTPALTCSLSEAY